MREVAITRMQWVIYDALDKFFRKLAQSWFQLVPVQPVRPENEGHVGVGPVCDHPSGGLDNREKHDKITEISTEMEKGSKEGRMKQQEQTVADSSSSWIGMNALFRAR